MAHIGSIIAKAQITNDGPIILVQPENEYSGAVGVPFPSGPYMQYVEDQLHKAGVVVPLISNDASTGGRNAPGTGVGEVDIYVSRELNQGRTVTDIAVSGTRRLSIGRLTHTLQSLSATIMNIYDDPHSTRADTHQGFDCARPTVWPAGKLPTTWHQTHEKQSPTTPYSIVEVNHDRTGL